MNVDFNPCWHTNSRACPSGFPRYCRIKLLLYNACDDDWNRDKWCNWWQGECSSNQRIWLYNQYSGHLILLNCARVTWILKGYGVNPSSRPFNLSKIARLAQKNSRMIQLERFTATSLFTDIAPSADNQFWSSQNNLFSKIYKKWRATKKDMGLFFSLKTEESFGRIHKKWISHYSMDRSDTKWGS